MLKNKRILLKIGVLIVLIAIFYIFYNPYRKQSSQVIIRTFIRNQTIFDNVRSYLNLTRAEIYIGNSRLHKIKTIQFINGTKRELHINDKTAMKNINNILFGLKFESIMKDSKEVRFTKNAKFEGFEQGIIFFNTGKRPIIYKQKELIHIKSNWYYYLSE